MKALIEGWRKAWGTEFPFYLVQLAPCTGQYGAGYGPGSAAGAVGGPSRQR